MSRCFPFPPPGYAKKTRVEDIDVLAKEKQKEKKLKKDKKERSSKEGKEKKEKDRSKQKHKDKKDRKEKHKDKDKNKDKEQTPDKKEPELNSIPRNGENLGPNSLQPLAIKDSKHVQEFDKKIKIGSNSLHPHESKGSKHLQELEKRIKYDDGASRSQSSEISTKTVSSDDKMGKTQAKTPDIFSNERAQMGKFSDKPSHTQNGKGNHSAKSDEKPPFSISEAKKLERQEIKLKEKDPMKSNTPDIRISRPTNHSLASSPSIIDTNLGKRNEPERNHTIVSSRSIVDTNLGKRKEPERNGILFDKEIRLKKASRNCNEMETKTGDHMLINNHGIALKEAKVNGFISPHRRTETPAKTPAKDNGEPSERVKSPHPDSKYLAQIFSVSEIEEVPESLDQSWLIANKMTKSLPPSSEFETEEVWSKAVRIESADVTALPYVIPY